MNDTQQASKTTSGAGSVSRLAKAGALWVILAAALAIPLSYYRSWILVQIDQSGAVLGDYAVILLFGQFVGTFVLFGGSSVLTHFLPKIRSDREKSAFILTYGLISLAAVAGFVCWMNLWPRGLSMLIRQPIDLLTLRIFSCLAPIVLLSQLAVFSLAGLIRFRVSSALNQIQVFSVCLFATAACLYFPKFLQEHSIVMLGSLVAISNVLAVAIGLRYIAKEAFPTRLQVFLPEGFCKYASFVHMNTLFTFAFQYIDQIFILVTFGKQELGAYFVLWQGARLVAFVPQSIGQVMLASFSQMVGAGDENELRQMYLKLSRLILIQGTPIALALILFSFPIASIFGAWVGERHLYLALLAAVMHIGTLGALNSMAVMAKERTGAFFINSLVLISLQLVVTFALVERLGILAVICGKFAGVVSGQIGLYYIVRWKLGSISLQPPREYWISLIVISAATTFSLYWNSPTVAWTIGTYITFLVLFLWSIRFRCAELLDFIRQSKLGSSR
ncbi:MAG: lipopolysaccharide biosynthesis protein [Planctomycetota bacterium]